MAAAFSPVAVSDVSACADTAPCTLATPKGVAPTDAMPADANLASTAADRANNWLPLMASVELALTRPAATLTRRPGAAAVPNDTPWLAVLPA